MRQQGSHTDLTERQKLEALVAWLPIFGTDFVAGRTEAGNKIEEGVYQISYVTYQEEVVRFEQMLYETGWILLRFDWGAWATGDEARATLEKTDAIAGADTETLAKVLTVSVRSDRFCEGALLEAFESGQILAVLRRAEELLSDFPKVTG